MTQRLTLLLLFALTAAPIAGGLAYALLYSTGLAGALNQGFTIVHWQKVLGSPETWQSLLLTLSITLAVLSLSVWTGLFLALRLRTDRFVLYGPLAVPPIAAAFLGFQLFSQTGFLSRISAWLSASAQPGLFPELVNDPWHLAVCVTLYFSSFPFFALMFINHYRAENLAALAALAQSLGAGRRQQLFRVVIPVLLQKSRTAILLWGIFLFGAYEAPLLLGRQNPRMISVLISHKFRKFNLDDVPQAYVLVMLYAALVVGATFLTSPARKKYTP